MASYLAHICHSHRPPSTPSAVTAYQNRCRSNLGKLFKFGNSDHLKEMLDRGHIKLRPASYYKDPSLNNAIGDDELHFTAEPCVADIHVHDSAGAGRQPYNARG